MANNQTPIEKVLLPMDLSKGLDERSRPESGGNPATLLTKLENLVQDETGGWVKRPGLEQLFSATSAGAAIEDNSKLIQLPYGLGLISSGRMYHRNVNGSVYNKSAITRTSVSGKVVASSQVAAPHDTSGHRILASASNDTFDVLAYEAGFSSDGKQSVLLVIVDRESDSQLAKYDLADFVSSTGTTTPNVKLAFPIGSNSLHVYAHDMGAAGATDIYWTSINLASLLPSSLTPTAVHTANPSVGETMMDIVGVPSGTVVAATGYGVLHVSTAGVASWRTGSANGGSYQWLSVDYYNGEVHCVRLNAVSTHYGYTVMPYTNLSAAPTVDYDTTILHNGTSQFVSAETGIVVVASEESTIFSATPMPMFTVYNVDASDWSLNNTYYGWYVMSAPFISSSGHTLIHLSKSYAGLLASDMPTVGPHVVANLTVKGIQVWGLDSSYLKPSLAVEAVLEPYYGITLKDPPSHYPLTTARNAIGQRYATRSSGSKVSIPVAIQTVGRSAGFAIMTLETDPKDSYSSSEFGGNVYVSSGVLSSYDGASVSEAGYLDWPCFTASAGAAGAPDGIYNYVAVLKHVDANGSVHYSRTFGPVSVTAASQRVNVNVQFPSVTSKEMGGSGDQQTVIELYRTESGGTQYYLCATSQVGKSASDTVQDIVYGSPYFTCDDNMADAVLIAKPIMYRQPGTAGTALDRYPAPASNIICQHKDRLFVVDQYGNRVYYSSFFVDGENAWFNPAFSIFIHGGSGPITGLASVDGRLVVFKRDAVFVVDGDGPPENGGNGSEFSPPSKLSGSYGCIDHRSIIATDAGVFYRSSRGIELLTRSLQVKWIGERVQNTVSDHPLTTAATMDGVGRAHFFLATDLQGTGIPGVGVELVLDTTSGPEGVWSTAKTWVHNASETLVYGGPIESACAFNDNGATRLAMCGRHRGVYAQTEDSSLDMGEYVPWTVETGWVRPNGTQAKFRTYDVMVLGKRRDNCALQCSIGYNMEDYDDDTRLWQADALQKTLVEVDHQPKNPTPVMFRVRIAESEPADQTAYPYTVGNGMDLLGISFNVGVKAGPQQVAPFRKG